MENLTNESFLCESMHDLMEFESLVEGFAKDLGERAVRELGDICRNGFLSFSPYGDSRSIDLQIPAPLPDLVGHRITEIANRLDRIFGVSSLLNDESSDWTYWWEDIPEDRFNFLVNVQEFSTSNEHFHAGSPQSG